MKRDIIIKSTDEYLSRVPEDKRKALENLRAVIKSIVIDAQEVISYQLPSFKYKYRLVGFGITKNNCSFYVFSNTLLKRFKHELEGFDYSVGTIHFSPEKPLPESLVRKLVMERMIENDEKWFLKNKN